MKISELNCPGCFLVEPLVLKDKRGSFIKTFQERTFMECGVGFDIEEEFCSISKKNTLRGMHFQVPPDDHIKYVYCLSGKVKDVFVDLRLGSPTYQKVFSVMLGSGRYKGLILPKGIAHGFLTLSDEAVMIYKTSHEYSPKRDTGILWSSFDFDWGVAKPIVSDRDSDFLPLNQFISPFIYKE